METSACKFQVTNIKISVKLPKSVDLDFVDARCKELSKNTTIYCSRKRVNIMTIRYNNYTYVLFKRSSKVACDGEMIKQHCNITKLKTHEDILKAIQDLFFLINQPCTLLEYTIDNYSCCADIFNFIDIERFFMLEQDVNCTYNEENFPALYVRCPREITSAPNQCCHIYRSGRIIFVGGKKLTEVKKFFEWIVEKTKPYIK